jgi:multiple sugar transport system substrate-binding protein
MMIMALLAAACGQAPPPAASQPTTAATQPTTAAAEPTTAAEPVSTPEPAAAAGQEPVTLQLTFFGGEFEVEWYENYVIPEWKKRHPEVTIETSFTGSSAEYLTKVTTMLAGNDVPDIVFFSSSTGLGLAPKGVFMSLNDLIAAEPNWNWDEWFPAARQTTDILRNGTIYGLPREGYIMTLFFNKDLFDEAGLPYPDENYTWKKLLADCEKLSRDTDGDGVNDRFCFQTNSFPHWATNVFRSWGAEPYSEDWKTAQFDDPKHVEAMQTLVDMRNKGHSPDPNKGQEDTFVNGTIAMHIEGPQLSGQLIQLATSPEATELQKFKWGMTVNPAGPNGDRVAYLDTKNYGIAAKSPHKEEAWELIKFLVLEGSQWLVDRGFIVPMKKPANMESWTLGKDAPAETNAFIKEMEYGRIWPRAAEGPCRDSYTAEMSRAFLGETSVEEASKIIDQTCQQLIGEWWAEVGRQ